MQYIVSGEEMQRIDACSIGQIGIPGIVLMERAALAMAEEVVRRFPSPVSVTVVTERGNNGGDGLALGRMLLEKGYPVRFYEIGGVKKASASYETQKKILEHLGVDVEKDLPEEDCAIWVDAIFGVGLKREVAGIQKEVIEKMNRKNGYKIAVDIPSGVDAATGQILGCGFQADLTVTFGFLKTGMVLYPGASFCGEVEVRDIGFPRKAVETVAPGAITYTEEDLGRLPERDAHSHKGSFGRVLLIAGARNMAGAAYLSAKAAYKTGSGLVRIFTSEANREILQTLLPEAILTTFASEEEALEKLPEALDWATVVGIGPGLGENLLTRKLLEMTLQEGKTPLVVDADGLNALAAWKKEEPEIVQNLYEHYESGMILTPHLKEMSRLSGQSVGWIQEHLREAVGKAADRNHVFVLKDARTVVSDGCFPTYINMSGNHGMATGGSGDVLTGILCGLLAGGMQPVEAARLGVYCHGRAGDAAAEEKGCYGMLAGDLVEALPKVIR